MTISWKQAAPAFAVGLLAGALLSFWAPRGLMHRGFHGYDMEHRQHELLERFSRKLSLTPEQRTKVGAILEEKGRKMKSLWQDTRPKFDEVRKSTSAEIRALLTPEQQTKFDALQQKMEARWKHHMDDRHP
jgi:Spy/CpxP family protein refolding chaperone